MKNFTSFLKAIALVATLLGAKPGTAQINQCSVALTYTLNANGNVGVTPVTAQSLGMCTYGWGNGVVTYSTGNTPAYYTYTANGVYTVTVACVNTAFTCTSIVTQTISVNNVTVVPCNVNSAFTTSNPSPGSYNFNSTSTGTSGTSSYSWNYGDGTTGTGPSSSHTYASDGYYFVVLNVTNATPATCSDTSFTYITVCTATNDFTWSNTANGGVSFTSSAPTTTASYFYWTFDDGGVTNGGPSTASAVAHTYSVNGTYLVSMFYSSAAGCSVTVQHTITVSNIVNPCTLNAGFSYSQGGGNTLNFMNTTTGASGGVTYLWNFGDGNTSTSTNPSHTYATAGNYNVTLFANNNFTYTCIDSTMTNVWTNTCVANAGFTLAPSGTPQYWNAYPAAPGNIAAATWSWGDGSTSNTLYTSHTYSAAGFYTICLTVTTTCGATGTSCWAYNIYKPANGAEAEGVVYVNVINASAVGIKNNTANTVAFAVSPNPSNGTFHVNLSGVTAHASIKVVNLVGQEIYAAEAESLNGSASKDVQLDNLANGVYFIKVNVDGQSLTKKIVISKN